MNKKNIILIVVSVVLGFIALCVLGLGLLVYLAVKFPKDPNETSTTEITTEIVTTEAVTEEVTTEEITTEQQTEEVTEEITTEVVEDLVEEEYPFVSDNELKDFIRNAYPGEAFSFEATVMDIYLDQYIIRSNDITFRANNLSDYTMIKNDKVIINCQYQGIDNAGQILIDIYNIELQ